jgi:hypothetical protein
MNAVPAARRVASRSALNAPDGSAEAVRNIPGTRRSAPAVEPDTQPIAVYALPTDELDAEERLRLAVLVLLYDRRRMDPRTPSISLLDLETMTGTERGYLEFTLWFLTQKGYVTRSESATLLLTICGAEFLEQQSRMSRRLPPMAG